MPTNMAFPLMSFLLNFCQSFGMNLLTTEFRQENAGLRRGHARCRRILGLLGKRFYGASRTGVLAQASAPGARRRKAARLAQGSQNGVDLAPQRLAAQ